MTTASAVALPEIAERVIARLDEHAMAVLDIYHRAKDIPHPRDAIARYASSHAHDFLNFASGVRRMMTGEYELTDETVERFARFEFGTDNLLLIARAMRDTHPDIYDDVRRIDALYRDDILRLRAYRHATT